MYLQKSTTSFRNTAKKNPAKSFFGDEEEEMNLC